MVPLFIASTRLVPKACCWATGTADILWEKGKEKKEKQKRKNLPLSLLAYCKYVVLRMVLCHCWVQSGRCGMCTSSGHYDGRRGATLAHRRMLSVDEDGRTEWKKDRKGCRQKRKNSEKKTTSEEETEGGEKNWVKSCRRRRQRVRRRPWTKCHMHCYQVGRGFMNSSSHQASPPV